MGYMAIGLIEFAVLALMFLLRKRLIGILFAGNQAARQLALEASQFDRRMSGVGSVATRAAARTIGKAFGGPAGGAAAGAAAGAMAEGNGGHSNGLRSGSSSGPALPNESLASSAASANEAIDPDSDYADHVEPLQSESLGGAAAVGQIGGVAAVGGATAAAGGSAVAAGVGSAARGVVAGRGSSAAGSAPVMPTVPLQSTTGENEDIPSFLRKRAQQSAQNQVGDNGAAGISSSSGAKILPMPGLNSAAAASAGSAGSGQGDYDDASIRPQSLSSGGLQTESLSAPSSGAGTIESVPLTSGASGGMAGLESLSSTYEAASGASERGGPSTYNEDSLYASMPNESAQGVTGDSLPPANASNSGSVPTIVPLNGSRAEAHAGASANESSVRSAAPNSSSATNQESFRTARGMESLESTEGSTPVHRTIGDSEVPPTRSGGVEDRASTANIALEATGVELSQEEIAEIINQSSEIHDKRESGSGEGE
ncbi:hypothetical protein [Paenibacillus shenyangensis]|uniref:hypothetical protein n=1 Tax=Paenibacillus sp. A9 TaxID=1284352 RepID=UPI00036845B8|nr:hypothetical protein [Paenibacillus sp. A9]